MLKPDKLSHAASALNPRTAIVRHELWSTSLYRQPNASLCRAYTSTTNDKHVPFRKQLKDEAKRRRLARSLDSSKDVTSSDRKQDETSEHQRWTLTVGLEIHAQLNTECKLFSTAKTASDDTPNSNVALFDLAYPGSQPEFQKATLIPALRAALGLSCNVRRTSRFDRKHYYYQDQPAGYQITQYYQPFATRGHVMLYDYDGIHPDDGNALKIGIQQVQMEQDTAKSTLQPPSTALIDFNRVGHPLIEIVTLPEIHHPQTAAACVKRIQAILQNVNAVTTGMEMGGLRADVNVSVSPVGSDLLGQRTEIKNLSSFKAVEDAISAERNRQIAVLEAGGRIEGETRGWSLGGTETKKLRGKEGEVDYRYMPDPDIPPLIIGRDLITHISNSLPQLPEVTIESLVQDGLTVKDAKTLVSLDDGERLDYFDEVRASGRDKIGRSMSQQLGYDKIVANWVLHELGGLLNAANVSFSPEVVPAQSMVEILSNLDRGRITGSTAKRLLAMVFDGDARAVNTIITQEELQLQTMSRDEYLAMAQKILGENPEKVKQIQQQKQYGKIQFFVGQMMRRGDGKIEAGKALDMLKGLLYLN